MALINDIYIFVESESVKRGVSVSEHHLEEGLDLTDNVKQSPITLSLSGEIVGENYKTDLTTLQNIHQKGNLIKYVGKTILSNAIITNFSTEHPNTISGGCSFSMELKEIRIAKSSYSKNSVNAGLQQIEKNGEETRNYTVKTGDCLWNIAKSYYGNGAEFTKILEANKEQIKNPNLIYPGQVLIIP